MERWVGRVALVTGASAGIGAAVVKRLVKYGMKVVGCAESGIDKMEKVKSELSSEKGLFIPFKCDLRDEKQILDMFGVIQRDFGGVDVCVNSAGIAHCSPLLTGETKDWRETLDVNLLAVCICSREAIKQMRNKGADDGHLFLINSLGGHRVISWPNGHFYCATKFGVSAIREGLRNELREAKSHIRVTCLQADDIADALIYAISAPPHVQVHDILIRPTEQLL